MAFAAMPFRGPALITMVTMVIVTMVMLWFRLRVAFEINQYSLQIHVVHLFVIYAAL